MKASGGVPDLGFFIDRTIKQCLEYDLDVSDTDAVLEDMARAWPASQDGAGQRSSHTIEEKGQQNRNRESLKTNCSSWDTPRQNGRVSESCSSDNNDKDIFDKSVENNATARPTGCYDANGNVTKTTPATSQPLELPPRREQDGNKDATNPVRPPLTLSVPRAGPQRRSVKDPSGSRSSPVSAGSKTLMVHGNLCAEVVKDISDPKGNGDLDLRRSNSCDELMSLEMPVRRDLEGPQASPSPEMTSSSPTSSRPAKLKSRLQLRYLEDEDGKLTYVDRSKFSETMEVNAPRNPANGSPAFSAPDIGVERESPIHGVSAPLQRGAPVDGTRFSGIDRKRQGEVAAHENEIAFPKKLRRGVAEDSSTQQQHHHHQKSPQRISPPHQLTPQPGPQQHRDQVMREEALRYPTFSRMNPNEELGSEVSLPGLLRQGLDLVQISGMMRHPHLFDPSQHRAGFLPTAPPHLNGSTPTRPREVSYLEANHIARTGNPRPQQRQDHVAVASHQQYHPNQKQELNHSDRCMCPACLSEQRQSGRHHTHNHAHQHPQQQYPHHHQQQQQQQPLYHPPKPQDRIANSEDPAAVADAKSTFCLKNPMHRIASIIAEELQKDDENGFDKNEATCRRGKNGTKLCARRCPNANCISQTHFAQTQRRSPTNAGVALRRDVAPQYHHSGSIPLDAHKTRPQVNGAEPLVHVNVNHPYHAEDEIQRERRQYPERPHFRVSNHHERFSPEHAQYYESRVSHHDEEARLNASLSREHPLEARVLHRQGIPAQDPYAVRDSIDHKVTKHSQLSDQSAPLSPSSRQTASYQPAAPTATSSLTPPPSHHQPRLRHAHLAPPSHNILLPSHHPMSHLSPTRVPAPPNGEMPSEDQPQDLSNKGKSAIPPTGYPNAPPDMLQNDHENGLNSKHTGPAITTPKSHSTHRQLTSEPPNPLNSFDAQPLNLTLKDRLKRGFYSTPSSPEIRAAAAATTGPCDVMKCPPGRKTP